MRQNRGEQTLYRRYIAELANTYRSRSDIRMFVELLLTLGAIFIFSLFAIRPTLVTIGGLSTEITEKRQTVKTMDDKIDNLLKAQDLFNVESGRLSLLETAVPSNPNLASYIKQMEAIAGAHTVQITSITTNNVKLSEEPVPLDSVGKSISFSVVFVGEYQNILASLNDIQNLRHPIKITKGEIYEDNSGELKGIYLSITGELPYVNLPNTIN